MALKIKTITCHNVYNVGASLQAYALVRYLKDMGHDVEIIDYIPEYLNKHYRLDVVNNPRYDRVAIRQLYLLAKLPGRLRALNSRRKKNFDGFTEEYLPTTKKRYHSNEELKKELPEADLYLAGSDQIWNTIFQNGRDPAFYLDFAPAGSIRASYAASFSTEDIVEEWRTPVKKWLESLDYISVREVSAANIIKDLGLESVVQVMDPVFLLNKRQWEEMCKTEKYEEPYLLIYDFDNNENINEFAKKISKERNIRIYSLFKNSIANKCFTEAGPLEFLNLIRKASYIVSNSFHATAFAIIFEKPFAVFEREEKINARLLDLLFLLNLCKINDYIDYDTINVSLGKKIDDSKEYLNKVLSNWKEK